jgi:predicted AlkP superfamily pyrophosphatase or phosphodiesterase
VSSLAELVPALLASIGAFGFADTLALGEAQSACLLLVDGLGDELLAAHADAAPSLAAHRASTLTAGFPSTTATSIASIGTARPPGEHGVVGYRWEPQPGTGLLNALSWRLAGATKAALDTVVPERAQPHPTAFERAGLPVTVVAPPPQRGSGLTRAALRGGRFVAAPTWGVLLDAVVTALREPGLVYAYVGDLDLTGHVLGPGTAGWRAQLGLVDHLVAALADRMPAGALLAVTGDHGMVDVHPDDRLDLDRMPDLLAGVRAVGGEPRARYVYAEPGAADDVLSAWRERLAGHVWVASVAEAVAAGWFGPTVADQVLPRLGDVVAAACDGTALVRSEAEPIESDLRGHHGSFTPAEQIVPLVLFHTSAGR